MDILEPVCTSPIEFVNKAIYYANNKNEIKKLENKIREKALVLFEEQASIDTWKEKICELYNSI